MPEKWIYQKPLGGIDLHLPCAVGDYSSMMMLQRKQMIKVKARPSHSLAQGGILDTDVTSMGVNISPST